MTTLTSRESRRIRPPSTGLVLGTALAAALASSGCVRELAVTRAQGVAFEQTDAQNVLKGMGEILTTRDAEGDFSCAADFAPEFAMLDAMTPEQRAQIEAEVVRRGGSLAEGPQPLQFSLLGNLQEFAGPRIVMTAADFNQVARTPAFVKVVGGLHVCGRTMTMGTILGCTPLNGRNTVVVVDIGGDRMPSGKSASQVWAHEFGHSTGLPDLRNQPTRVMNGFLDPRALTITREDCLTYTRVIDGDGPTPRGMVSQAAPAPESPTRRDPQTSVEDFVRQQHIHGMGIDLQDDFGPGDVAPLLRMLADPTETAPREQIFALLGLIGDAAVADVLLQNVEQMRGETMAWARAEELTSALLGLGAIANREQSRGIVAELETLSEPVRWSVADPALGQHIQLTARIALAMSGMQEARDLLARAAADNRDPALQANLDEVAAASELVARRGLRAYMNGEEP